MFLISLEMFFLLASSNFMNQLSYVVFEIKSVKEIQGEVVFLPEKGPDIVKIWF